jgi:hypothetical protein
LTPVAVVLSRLILLPEKLYITISNFELWILEDLKLSKNTSLSVNVMQQAYKTAFGAHIQTHPSLQ